MYTRRGFLKTTGLAMLSIGLGGSPDFLHRAAQAATQSGHYGRRKTLVAIFQRGGMDGLMAVPLFGDPMLERLRPNLSMAAPVRGSDEIIDLDGRFGLHQVFAPLESHFKDKRLAILHGVGSPNPTRSHFDAQDYMESGTPFRKGTPSGWLNRVSGLLGHEASPLRAVAMAKALPHSLYGDQPAIAISDLEDFRMQAPGAASVARSTDQSFEALYEQTSQELLRGTSKETFEAMKLIAGLDTWTYQPANGVDYPRSPLGQSLKQIAQLIKSEVGLEIAFTETNGWDTHVRQGTLNGSFAQRAGDLAQGIAAFWDDLGKHQDNVVVMTMTEFGRTVRENGSNGTDHGRGSCMFVLGNRVDGGKVHGTVGSLAPDALEDGRDLPVTTDFRAVFAEVAGKHLGVKQDRQVFPEWEGSRLQLLRG